MGGQVQIFTSPNPKNLQIGLASSRAFLNASMASGCLGAQDRFEDWNIRTRDGDLKSCWVYFFDFQNTHLAIAFTTQNKTNMCTLMYEH